MFYFPKDMLVDVVDTSNYEDNQDIVSCTVPIDQYDSQDFNKNDFGYIRNDISQLARAQSVQEYDLLMKKLQVLKKEGNLPSDVKPEQAISRVRSRYLQSPNELLSYAESLARGDMQKLDDAYRKAMSDVKVAEQPLAAPVDTVPSSSVSSSTE